MFLSIQNEREFERFCDVVLSNPALKKDPRFSTGPVRAQNRDAMHAEIEAVFSGISSSQVIEKLEKAEIANAKLNSMREFWDHPQLEARDRWREVATPAGSVDAMKPPFNLDGFEPRMDAVPALGEHSGSILEGLGFSAIEIQQLEEANVVRLGGKS